uniref:Metalloproteinase n=1 Tax=Centruroides hentzi TaxID=88313 RepID=A0A2I9LP83_9SCOR
MLFYLLSVSLCVVISAIPSGRIDVVYPSIETLRSGMKMIKFRTFDRDIELKLEPAGEVISDDFAVVSDDQKQKQTNIEFLKRNLYRDKEKGVALHINEDGPLSINGILSFDLRIKPLDTNNIDKYGNRAHRIIEVLQDQRTRVKIVIPDIENKTYNRKLGRNEEDECVELKYIFLAESQFTKAFENDTVALEEYLSVTMVQVQNFMDTLDLRIKVRLVKAITFTEETEPEFMKNSAIKGHEKYLDANKLIGGARDYICQSRENISDKADIIFVISKRRFGEMASDGKINSGIAGMAYVGIICNDCYKTGLVLDDTNIYERSDTIAHESCHILGSPHDGEGPVSNVANSPGSKNCSSSDGYIMGDRNRVNGMKFSPCTRDNIENILKIGGYDCIKTKCTEE